MRAVHAVFSASRCSLRRRASTWQAEAERRIQHRVDSHLISGRQGDGRIYPVALYRSTSFDHIWGWEARWWDRVPEPERSKITFFNEPVSAGDASALC